MSHYQYIIIGAGIAGSNAAATIRKESPEASIALIGDELYPVYSRVNISKVAAAAKSPEELLLKTEEQFRTQNINHIIAKVIALDTEAKSITLDNGEILQYDKVLVSTGGRARKLTQIGADLAGVFSFQTLDDAIRVRDYIQDKEHITIVGGGFIGIEFVELLSALGKKVTLIIREEWYWKGMIDKIGGNLINAYIHQRANVYYNTEIQEIKGENGAITEIVLQSGEIIPTEAICIGIGLELNKDFLPAELCNRGLKVNQYLVSENPDIFAAGDIAEYYDILQETVTSGGTWANASLQGMIAGYNMVHTDTMKPYSFIPVFSPKTTLPIAFVGSCRLGADMQMVVIEQGDRYVQVNTNPKGIIVGGVIIGDSAYMGAIRKWVEGKTHIDNIVSRI
jgi:NADPH-dependent 2,4-dienoyl-CoA reductase/sulfur reductase-like enzyme